jgi:hypothetical protein
MGFSRGPYHHAIKFYEGMLVQKLSLAQNLNLVKCSKTLSNLKQPIRTNQSSGVFKKTLPYWKTIKSNFLNLDLDHVIFKIFTLLEEQKSNGEIR